MTRNKIREWTVDEYHRMIEAGILTTNDQVELLDGQIVEMSPQQSPHASTTQRMARYLDRLLETVAYVRTASPSSTTNP